MGPLDDAVRVLQELIAKYPALNAQPFCFGKLEIEFKDGRVWSVGPYPLLLRGKEFSASARQEH